MRITVVLPAPFGPRKPKHSPSRNGNIDAVHGTETVVILDQVMCNNNVHATS